MKQIEQLESFNVELDATVKEQTEMLNGGKLYEGYQEVCIKNSKLNATVDVLVEKISMLKRWAVMDNGMELRVKDYCAFCPDFDADVDKVDITVLADRTQRALTTIRCRHAEKCERIYGRIQEGRTNETTVVQSSV